MNRFGLRVAASVLAFALCTIGYLPRATAATQGGNWLVRVGASIVDPQSDNGKIHLERVADAPPSDLSIDSAASLTFNVSYFVTQSIAIELLAAYPFSHDFELKDVNLHGKVDHLPPTLSLQYHFALGQHVEPYVGAGVNWTMFSNEEVDAPVNLSIDDSVGIALQVGADFPLNDHWLVNVDVRWIQIEGDAQINGVNVGTVKVDPFVYGVNVGYKF
jgi:outer membrane protein